MIWGPLGPRPTTSSVFQAPLYFPALYSPRFVTQGAPTECSESGKSGFSETTEPRTPSPLSLSFPSPWGQRDGHCFQEELLPQGAPGPGGDRNIRAGISPGWARGRAASQNSTFLDDGFSLESARRCFHGLMGSSGAGPESHVRRGLCAPPAALRKQNGATEPGAGSPDAGCSILRFSTLFPSSCHLVRGKGKRGRENTRPKPEALITPCWVEIPTLQGGGAPPPTQASNPVTQNSSLVMGRIQSCSFS